MKQSLSGVWKAYVIHTMKGQSCREADIGLEQREASLLSCSAEPFSIICDLETYI